MQAATSLLDSINASLGSNDLQLPVYSPIAAKLQSVVQDPNCDAHGIERLLVHDQALAGHVLRAANSVFFSGLSKVETIRAAIMRLGMRQIVSITVAITQKGNYRAQHPTIAKYMDTLWKHAYATAVGSRWVATKAGYSDLAYEAFLGGLFHDIGKLLLLRVMDDACRADSDAGRVSDTLIMEILDKMHVEQGHRLAREWNLADTYAEIVRTHHDAEADEANVPALIVRLVNLACRKLGFSLHHDPSIVLHASAEAAMLGLSELKLAELEIRLEDGMAGSS